VFSKLLLDVDFSCALHSILDCEVRRIERIQQERVASVVNRVEETR
jgi:hypothetical protein